MIQNEQGVPCPLCNTKIPIDTMQLLAGILFPCPNTECDASIGLVSESKPLVADTMEKFDVAKTAMAGKR